MAEWMSLDEDLVTRGRLFHYSRAHSVEFEKSDRTEKFVCFLFVSCGIFAHVILCLVSWVWTLFTYHIVVSIYEQWRKNYYFWLRLSTVFLMTIKTTMMVQCLCNCFNQSSRRLLITAIPGTSLVANKRIFQWKMHSRMHIQSKYIKKFANRQITHVEQLPEKQRHASITRYYLPREVVK